MVITSLHCFQPVPQYHKLTRAWPYKTHPPAQLAQSERQEAGKGQELFSLTLAVVRLVIATTLN